MHLVYSLREPLGDELRYSLRSAAKNANVEKITIVGDAPDWVKDVEVLEGNTVGEPYCNSYANILIAANHFPGEFVSMNDDFIFMQPAPNPIPHWWERPMTQQAARSPDPRSHRHRNLMLETNMYLSQRGVVIPKSYELHIPMRIEGKELLRIARGSRNQFTTSHPPRWRSLYGNLSPLVNTVATRREDVQYHVLSHMPEDIDFLATDERTFKNFLPTLKKKFPKKSPWEK